MSADFPMEFHANRYDGEEQIVRTLKAKMKYTEEVTGDTFVKKVEARLFTQKVMPWTEVRRRAATNPAWQWHRPDALDKLKADCLHRQIWREDGSYVEKGPFPLPAAGVKVQELSRDEDTGRVRLRVTPSNADTVYVKLGADATPASQRLTGRDYKTEALVVSFLAVDSTGVHPQGAPVTWHNRITLKGRIYGGGGGGDARMIELRAAPRAPIRYTTDGSDPSVAGGTYDDPFGLAPGTRLVLAVAESRGIRSEPYRLDVPQGPGPGPDPASDRPIDREQPCTWRPVSHPGGIFSFTSTHGAYGFLERLARHQGQAAARRIAVLDGQWADLQIADDLLLGAEQLRATVEHLRSLVSEGEVTIEASALWFPTGQQLLDYVHDIAVELQRHEVEP